MINHNIRKTSMSEAHAITINNNQTIIKFISISKKLSYFFHRITRANKSIVSKI